MNSGPHYSKPFSPLGWNNLGKTPSENFGGYSLSDADWIAWVRIVERKRRLLRRRTSRRSPLVSDEFFGRMTYASFRLEGLDVREADVVEALARGPARRAFRSRLAQRIRNHVAILYYVQGLLRRGEQIKPLMVIRWYTSVSSGLSTTLLDASATNRIDQVVRRIHSPQGRLQRALREIVRLHVQLIADPLVPGFNGILTRLLLHYHMGCCGLPPVLFDPKIDLPRTFDERMLLMRLTELTDASLEALLNA